MDNNSFIIKIKPLISLVITLFISYRFEYVIKQLLEYQTGNKTHDLILFFILPLISFSLLNKISEILINKLINKPKI